MAEQAKNVNVKFSGRGILTAMHDAVSQEMGRAGELAHRMIDVWQRAVADPDYAQKAMELLDMLDKEFASGKVVEDEDPRVAGVAQVLGEQEDDEAEVKALKPVEF